MVSLGMSNERKPKRGGRPRSRTNPTYLRKANRLKTKYQRLYRQSVKSKEIFEALPEQEQTRILKQRSQGRKDPKPFFCVSYPNFEAYLAKYNLKQVVRESSNNSRPSRPKGLWGN